jgi:hypothetical protein
MPEKRKVRCSIRETPGLGGRVYEFRGVQVISFKVTFTRRGGVSHRSCETGKQITSVSLGCGFQDG